MQVTLARALKLKKRIIERIEKYEEDITLSNRIIVGNIRDIDVNETMRLKKNLKDILINLKVKIHEAGAPIRHEIFTLSEIKSDINFLKAIPTDHGKVFRRNVLMDEGDVEYSVILTKADIDKDIKTLQSNIDSLQFDIIDKYNSVTMVEVGIDNLDDI